MAYKLIGRVKIMKINLSRNWDRLTMKNLQSLLLMKSLIPEETDTIKMLQQCSTLLTLKTDCMKCVNRRSVVRALVESYKKLKSKHCKSKDKLQKNHQLVQALKRKTCIERSLRPKLREQKQANSKKYIQISHLVTANCDELLRENECINTKCNEKTYSTACRKAIYHCLLNQVPVTSVYNVIEAVILELCDKAIDVMPDSKFVSVCGYELGIISDLQVGEILYSSENVTLSWDSTTVDGQRINEVHFSIATIPPTSYVMQLGVLPGGTCDDYLTHITNCFDDIAETYDAYNQLDIILVKHLFVQHIKNTLTDRVAVNHCVVQALNTDLDIELLELKCNVYPIDGIAKKCTDLLIVYDE